MLGLMRALTQNKFTGGILLGLVILSMAVWGIEDIFSGNFGQNIIQAGERGVTEQQLNRKFENYLNTVRRDNPANSLTRQEAVEQGILDQIYAVEQSRIVSLGYARSLGADASPKALLEEVRSIPAFTNPATNEFDQQYYRNALRTNNVSVEEFENDTQDRLTLDYIKEAVEAALVAPTDIARVQAVFDGEVRYIAWIPIDRSSIDPVEPPTDEDLAAFYEERSASFEVPERRQLSMIRLSVDDFLHQVEVTEEDIVEVYDATKMRRLATPEQRTFTEIVYQDGDTARQAFGAIAVGGEIDESETVSVNTRTAVKEDVSLELFREQLFSPRAEAGAVAGPLETPAGWMIGRLNEILPGTPKTLEETREEISQEIARESAEIAYYTATNEFDDLIGQGLPLEEIADVFGTPTLSFAPVDARGLTEDGEFIQELTQSPEAFRQAFEFPQGTTTDRFDEGASTLLISIDAIMPKSVPPLEENLDRAQTAFRIVREGEALKSAVDEAKADLDGGAATLDAIADKFVSDVMRPERGLRRTAFDNTLPRSVLQAAFSLSDGESSVVQGRAPTELILVKLENVDRPEASDLDVLAPISAPKIAEQLTNDILFAYEQEVQAAMELETDDRGFATYRARLLIDQ